MTLRHKTLILALLTLLLQGCAGIRPSGVAADPRDPWEGMNRRVYAFNDSVDRAVIRPVALAYDRVTPSPVRAGVRNFLGNLGDVWTAANAGLQLKGRAASESFMRVVINSTLGLYGLLDIASEAGLPKYKEDFGQTLGYWGVKPGPYVVLPLMEPGTLRDTAALLLDMQAKPGQFFNDSGMRTGLTVLGLTEKRAGLMLASDAVQQAALDPYSFVRDAWLQKRENEVYDGNPPSDFDYSDPDKY
jgi:phospholipid-binding lipoprotein MlaA